MMMMKMKLTAIKIILHNCYALKSRNFYIHFSLHLVETVARF